MDHSGEIRFIPRGEIDTVKWDNCIGRSANGLIYGYSWYLDHMARQWDGLVLNDYESVMPLTWHKKYGVHYLYQPFLAAQLGVFGNAPVDAFLKTIPSKFSYWDIYLNHGNHAIPKAFPMVVRKNFILDLSPSYEDLYRSYSPNIQRNIRKSEKLGAKPVIDFPVDEVIELAAEQMKHYARDHSADMARFKKLFRYLQERQQAITYGMRNTAGELMASCVFLFSHNRAYYLLVGNHPKSRHAGASHSLVDAFIRDHANKQLLLDFEGSDVPGLAHFYGSFGSQQENYPAIRLNRLPFYIKWLKKS